MCKCDRSVPQGRSNLANFKSKKEIQIDEWMNKSATNNPKERLIGVVYAGGKDEQDYSYGWHVTRIKRIR